MKNNPEEAIDMMTNFSEAKTSQTFEEWEKLFIYLLVKYVDGNIKCEENGRFVTNGDDIRQPAFPDQPEYPESWYRVIIDDCGDNIAVPK